MVQFLLLILILVVSRVGRWFAFLRWLITFIVVAVTVLFFGFYVITIDFLVYIYFFLEINGVLYWYIFILNFVTLDRRRWLIDEGLLHKTLFAISLILKIWWCFRLWLSVCFYRYSLIRSIRLFCFSLLSGSHDLFWLLKQIFLFFRLENLVANRVAQMDRPFVEILKTKWVHTTGREHGLPSLNGDVASWLV